MRPIVFLLAVLLVLAGCAGPMAFRDAKDKIAQGKVEEGLKRLDDANKAEPLNAEYRLTRAREREAFITELLAQADRALVRSDLDEASAAFQRILNLDPVNTRAQAGLDVVRMGRRHNILLEDAEVAFKRKDYAEARALLARVTGENPQYVRARTLQERLREATTVAAPGAGLRAAFRKPVTLEFRDTAMRTVFELLSRSSGINFMFDKDVRADLRVTMFVKDTTIEDAIRFMLVTNQLERRVLNDNTVLIYPNTPAKAREYQELMVKTFYLGNADVKQALNLIRTIVKTRDIVVDEKLNTIIMRDTPEAVRLAEKLIRNQDLAEPEVMLELEVLEVGLNKLQELGIRYPDSVAGSVIGAAGTAGVIRLPEARAFDPGMVSLSLNNPLLIANLKRTVTEQNLLANPRIRVRNREKAKIHIGEKVPVITTTVTANVGVSESVNYLDVGLKLEIEPNIYLEDEVAIKVGLEVSSILDTVNRASGLQTYRLGTRNAVTVLRLRDNETQILAGLIQKDERVSSTRIPGLGDIPILGRLFSNQADTDTKTEIVLLITPRVIRNIARPSLDIAEFASGTESSIGGMGLSSSGVSGAQAAGGAVPAQLNPGTTGATIAPPGGAQPGGPGLPPRGPAGIPPSASPPTSSPSSSPSFGPVFVPGPAAKPPGIPPGPLPGQSLPVSPR